MLEMLLLCARLYCSTSHFDLACDQVGRQTAVLAVSQFSLPSLVTAADLSRAPPLQTSEKPRKQRRWICEARTWRGWEALSS